MTTWVWLLFLYMNGAPDVIGAYATANSCAAQEARLASSNPAAIYVCRRIKLSTGYAQDIHNE